MFAKIAVFFFAFVAFVNAAPVTTTTKLGLGEGPANPWNPFYGIGPVKVPGVTYVSSKRREPLEFGDANLEASFESGLELNNILKNPPHRRGAEGASVMGASAMIGRDEVNAITAHIFDVPLDLGKNTNFALGELNAVARVQRDIVIDSQTLDQLNNLVNAVVSALLANGNSQAVNTFLTQVNNLKTEVENGTLDVQDLLSTAQLVFYSLV